MLRLCDLGQLVTLNGLPRIAGLAAAIHQAASCSTMPALHLQVLLGQVLHQVDELLPASSLPFDDIAAAVLLLVFGLRTLQAGAAPHGLYAARKLLWCTPLLIKSSSYLHFPMHSLSENAGKHCTQQLSLVPNRCCRMRQMQMRLLMRRKKRHRKR